MIRINQKLVVSVNHDSYDHFRQSTPTAVTQAAPLPVPASKIHMVQPGDSLWKISQQYEGLSIEKIKELNNLKSNKIVPGQKLIVG